MSERTSLAATFEKIKAQRPAVCCPPNFGWDKERASFLVARPSCYDDTWLLGSTPMIDEFLDLIIDLAGQLRLPMTGAPSMQLPILEDVPEGI